MSGSLSLSLTQSVTQHGHLSSGSSGSSRWFVAQTIARAEDRANAQLKAQAFETFFPRVRRTVRHARKLRTVLTAAFPGYVFVRLDLERDRWRSVNGTYGVSRLIMMRDVPAPVPIGVVETIISYADTVGIVHFERDLYPGQSVRIKEGPLADAMGKLVRLDAGERVQVLLDIMSGKIHACVDRAALEAA